MIPDDSARTERIGRVVASGLAQQKKTGIYTSSATRFSICRGYEILQATKYRGLARTFCSLSRAERGERVSLVGGASMLDASELAMSLPWCA